MMGSDLVSSRLRSRLLLAVRASMNRNVEGMHCVLCSKLHLHIDTLAYRLRLDNSDLVIIW